MKYVETLSAHTTDVEVQYELIHHALQRGQIPTTTAYAFDLFRREIILAQVVTIGRADIFDFVGRRFLIRFFNRRKTFLDTIRVVTARISPQHNGRAGVDVFTRDDDLISGAWSKRTDAWRWRDATSDG